MTWKRDTYAVLVIKPEWRSACRKLEQRTDNTVLNGFCKIGVWESVANCVCAELDRMVRSY